MPNPTFFKLPTDKKDRITRILLEEFTRHCFHEANVKRIVEKAKIPRGSFYQYFADLYDAYCYILDEYTVDMHELFLSAMESGRGDWARALEAYKRALTEEIFEKEKYPLYRSIYLFWSYDLSEREKAYRRSGRKNPALQNLSGHEKMEFLKAVLHDLMKRLFINQWSKDVCLPVHF